MSTFFLFCAVGGGTFMLLQLALLLLGVGHDTGAGHGPTLDGGVEIGQGHETAWSHLGRFLTVQALVAFVAFFGIAGLATLQAGLKGPAATLIALGCGLAAMYLIGSMFAALAKLRSDGSVDLSEAVGLSGRVYLKVPGESKGLGKVTVDVGGRSVELAARTPGPELPNGAPIVVTQRIDAQTFEVLGQETVA